MGLTEGNVRILTFIIRLAADEIRSGGGMRENKLMGGNSLTKLSKGCFREPGV